jgi:hypothetical protein
VITDVVAHHQGEALMDTLTVTSLRRAIESRDGVTLAGFYMDDAVLSVIDQNNPPSRPLEIRGRDAITAYYADVGGRTMTHRVDSGVAEGDRLLFSQTCTYPDGKRVFCAATLELCNRCELATWDQG